MSNIEDNKFNDHQQDGRVMPPLLLYFLGLPAGICLILWLLFFRG